MQDGGGGGKITSDLPRLAWHPVLTLLQRDFYQVNKQLGKYMSHDYLSLGMKAATGPMDTILTLHFYSRSSLACLVLTGLTRILSKTLLITQQHHQIFHQVLPGLPCHWAAQVLNPGLLLHWALGLINLPTLPLKWSKLTFLRLISS